MAIVIDASIAATWCFRDRLSTAEADAVMARIHNETAIVPDLFWHEIRNVLVGAERKGRIEAEIRRKLPQPPPFPPASHRPRSKRRQHSIFSPPTQPKWLRRRLPRNRPPPPSPTSHPRQKTIQICLPALSKKISRLVTYLLVLPHFL